MGGVVQEEGAAQVTSRVSPIIPTSLRRGAPWGFAMSLISLSGISGLVQTAGTALGNAGSAVTTGANAVASAATQAVQGGHHHHGGGGGKLFQKIQQSVLSALQAQTQTPGNVSANQTVQSAIGQILQARFNSAAGSNASSSTTEEPGDTDVDSTSVQQFFQQLQSYGITPEQFRQDFLGAMQQSGQTASNGQAAAIPTGLLVNLLA